MYAAHRPTIVAHRGASITERENTIAAFAAAVAQGADAVELDVRWTRDLSTVVYHDPTILSHGRKVAVNKLTAAEFIARKAEEGVAVPTLREALAWAKDRLPLVFDIKDTRREERLIAELEAQGFHLDSVFSSFRLTVIGRIKARRPNWKTAWIIGNWGSRTIRQLLLGAIITRAIRWGVGALHFHEQWIGPELVARCHRAGLNVAAWTVDDPLRIRRLAEYGVDAIITNVPDRARQVLADRQSDGTQ